MTRRTILALVRLLPTVSLPLTLALAATALVQPALSLGFMLAVGRFVGQIPAAVGGDTGWTYTLGLVAAFYFGQQAVGAGTQVVGWRLGQRLNHHLDDRAMASLLDPPGIAHLENARIRDLAAEAADGLGAGRWRPAEVPGALHGLVTGVIGLAISFGLAIWLQWWLGLLLLGTTVWALHEVSRHILGMLLGPVLPHGEAEFRRLEYERDAAVAPYSAKEVRLFGFASWALDRWQARLLRLLDLNLAKMGRFEPRTGAAMGAMAVVVGGGFAWAAVEAGRGGLGLAAATILAQALLAPLGQIKGTVQPQIDLTQAARPVTALRTMEAELPAVAPVADGGSDPAGRPRSSVRFEHVTFRYPGTETEVLRDLDLEIPAGSSLAVVGLNGAGKTTLVKLLCGFYDPTYGRISVDGTDLRELDRAAWQRRVAAIFQDFARYPMAARDNVGAGRLGADQEVLEAAARRAGAAELVAGLPAGWDTVLSREFTAGADLSGGQWQRIALARALLAADQGAGVLVLDEPAANLDVRAEAELNERFLDLTGERDQGRCTTLVISHRLSTVRRADRICVLAEGRVVESGDHDELLAAGGQYAELFRLQAGRFT